MSRPAISAGNSPRRSTSDAVVEFRRPLPRHANCWRSTTCTVCRPTNICCRNCDYTLDAYEESGGIVVVTSHRPATALGNLPPDLAQPPGMPGLMLQLAAPGKAARARIVRHVAASFGRPLSDEAVSRLAAGCRERPASCSARCSSCCGAYRTMTPRDVEARRSVAGRSRGAATGACAKLSPSWPSTTACRKSC